MIAERHVARQGAHDRISAGEFPVDLRGDLRRWATAFAEDPDDVDIYDRENGYARHNAEETRRRTNLHTALKELEPWWEALWD